MKHFLSIFTVIFIITGCSPKTEGNPERFKVGNFEIPAGDGYGKTTITRTDSLQIEKYTKLISVSNDSATYTKEEVHIDTLFVTWKNNFAYTLRMKNPKTVLDKDPIFVQITKVTDTSYSFNAKIGYSNFKNSGTVYISKN